MLELGDGEGDAIPPMIAVCNCAMHVREGCKASSYVVADPSATAHFCNLKYNWRSSDLTMCVRVCITWGMDL